MPISSGKVEADENSIEEGLVKEAVNDVEQWDREHRSWFIFFNILRVVSGFFGIIASCFLIYLILRFRTLHKWIYFYIVALAIFHIVYCEEPIVLGIYSLVDNTLWLPVNVVKYAWTIADVAYVMLSITALLLALQRCLEIFAPHLAEFQRNWYKVILGLLGCLYLVLFGVSFAVSTHFISQFASRFYAAVFLVVLGINIALCFVGDRKKGSDCLLICNITIFSHCLYILYILLMEFFFMKSHILRAVTTFTKIIPRLVTNLMPVWMLLTLINMNKHFKHAYSSILGRNTPDDMENSMDSLVEDE